MSRGHRQVGGSVTHAAPAAAETPTKQRTGLARPLVWLLGGGVLFGALIVGVFAALWLYQNVVVYIPIRDQPIGVSLPEKFTATARVSNDLEVAMDGQISTSVPFKQDLIVPFKGRYDFDVDMQADVPVDFDVVYDGILPIDTQADVTLRTGINYKNLKALRNITIETSLPLKFPLPIKLNIPVSDVIDLRYSGPLSADINQDVKTRVDTVLKTRLPVNQTITTPVKAALPLTVYPEDRQVRLLLSTMDIVLKPSSMLTFKLPDDISGPQRVDSPWGPLDQTGPDPAGAEN